MSRPRYSAPLRILALAVLLWVGFDIGAHGLFASDFRAVSVGGESIRCQDDPGAGQCGPTGHCFCHSVSVGAMLPAPSVGLTPAGTLVFVPPPQVPHTDPQPLDRPPQFVA